MLRLGVEPDPHPALALEEAEAEEASSGRASDPALLAVHPELEPPLHEGRDALEDASRRSFGRHVDPEVVGVAHERVAPSFQLVVEVVEHDVGQQRRER